MPAGDPLGYLNPAAAAPEVETAAVAAPVETPAGLEEEVVTETVAVDTPAAMADAIISRTPGSPEELLSILSENGWELVQTGAPSAEVPVEETMGVGEEPAMPISGSPTNNLADLRRMAAASAIRGEGVV
jgi:hypothetical protein